MVRRIVPLSLPLLLAALGCLPENRESLLVPDNPFNRPPAPPTTQVAYPAAPTETATRVALVGQKLIDANLSQYGVRPFFRTIGSPQREVFHQGTVEIDVTDGLAKDCTEGQLAGVLAMELGKMIEEREAQANQRARAPEREPPAPYFIGGDGASSRGGADLTHLAELAPYDEDRRRAMAPPPPPEPESVARAFLLKAGYSAADLNAAQPLLHAAAANTTLEKQLASPPPGPEMWTR